MCAGPLQTHITVFTVGIEAARVQAGFMVSFNKTVIAYNVTYIHT